MLTLSELSCPFFFAQQGWHLAENHKAKSLHFDNSSTTYVGVKSELVLELWEAHAFLGQMPCEGGCSFGLEP